MYTLDRDNKVVEMNDSSDVLPELKQYSINTTMPVIRDWETYTDGATAVTNYDHSMARAGNYISVLITPVKDYEIHDIMVYVDDKEFPHYMDDSEINIEEDGDKRIVHFTMPPSIVDVSCSVKPKLPNSKEEK